MYHYRFFIDRKIEANADGVQVGGDHIRVVDVEADEMGMDAARKLVQERLPEDEVIGGVAEVNIENPDDPQAVNLHYATTPDTEGRWVIRTGEDSP